MTPLLVEFAPPRAPASAAGNDHLVGSLLAFVVEPGDRHLLAGLAAFEAKMQKRIARNRGSPLRRQHGLAAMRYGHVPDEMRRNGIAASSLRRPVSISCAISTFTSTLS